MEYYQREKEVSLLEGELNFISNYDSLTQLPKLKLCNSVIEKLVD
jgi:hypothetical protein